MTTTKIAIVVGEKQVTVYERKKFGIGDVLDEFKDFEAMRIHYGLDMLDFQLIGFILNPFRVVFKAEV